MAFGCALSRIWILTPQWKINKSSFAYQIYTLSQLQPGQAHMTSTTYPTQAPECSSSPLCFLDRSIPSDPGPARARLSLRMVDNPTSASWMQSNIKSSIKKHQCHHKLPSIIWQGCLQASHFPQQLCVAVDRSDSIITALVLENYCKACGLKSGSITLLIRY